MTQDELKALIEDLRLNHEYCPKEVILQAADELEALAHPEQEPVGQLLEDAFGRGQVMWFNKPKDESMLYSTPPQRTEPVIDKSAAIRIATTLGWTPPRTWVGLTDEEFQWVYDHGRTPAGMMEMIEAKLKEKNT
jgi:hypothetical protein